MHDRTTVEAMVAGDRRGLDDAYRRYAPRLMAYCTSLLRDPDAAADAVHDTFLIAAERASQLRDPDRLSAWLYAIARHECLRHLRSRDRSVPLDFEVAAVSPEPSSEAVEVVRSAAHGLNSGDREVVELALRHELSAVDVAAILGIPPNHAHARLSRARSQLSQAVGALLVARSPACTTLAPALTGWDGRLDPLTRKRITRHIASCALCSARRDQLVAPLISVYAGLPFAAVTLAGPLPAALDLPPADPWSAGSPALTHPPSTAPPAGPSPFDPSYPSGDPAAAGFVTADRPSIHLDPGTGFPIAAPAPAEPRRPARSVRWPYAVFGLILTTGVLLSVLALVLVRCSPPPETEPTADLVPATAAPIFSVAATPASLPAAPSPGTSSAPVPSPPLPSPAPPAAFSVSVIDTSATCTVESGTFKLYVKVAATGSIAAARLYWVEGTGPQHSLALNALDARTAEVTKVLLREPTDWWVRATATDGSTAQTPRLTVRNPCV